MKNRIVKSWGTLQGKMRFIEEVGSNIGCDFKLTGYGNTKVPFQFEVTDGSTPSFNFQEECISVYNKGASNILRGDLVKLMYFSKNVEKLGVSDGIERVFGIAFQDIPINSRGIVKFGGYFRIADTSLVGATTGKKIGVTSGVLSVVTGSEYLAVETDNIYMILK